MILSDPTVMEDCNSLTDVQLSLPSIGLLSKLAYNMKT
jgi:hypothetical protein